MRQLYSSLLAALLLFALTEAGAAQSEPRHILLLHSFGRNHGPWNSITWELRDELARHANGPIDFHEASLENERPGMPAEPHPLLAYLRSLFPQRDPELSIAVGAPAARFMLRHRAELFPSTPLLITGADQRAFADAPHSSNHIAIPLSIDHAKQIENILQLLPNVRHIAVIIGDSNLERFWADTLKSAFRPYERRVTFEWLSKAGLDDIVDRTAQLPPHSAVYYLGVLLDGQGAPYEVERVLGRLRRSANAPMFSFIDSNFGLGIVGGPMISVREIAQQSATVAARLLQGEELATIATTPIGESTPRYDGRELDRWQISENRLPAESEIFFREPSAWDHYRVQIVAIISALLLQTALISWLIYEHRRRHLAEVQSRRLITELTYMNRLATAGELSASIAHEVNQPLTRVMANASAAIRWLAAKPPDIGKIRELLQQIVNASDRAARVIASTRAMFAKADGARARVDMKQLINSVLTLVRHDLQEHGVELDLHFGEQPLVVHGDRGQLQQLVLNLVMNAIEAMASRQVRVLKVRCEHDERGRIIVSIADTGSGIDADHLDRVFEPLFTTKRRGMGMGLSICRSIIENHDGRIWTSPAPGGGSIFWFELPAHPPAPGGGRDSRRSSSRSREAGDAPKKAAAQETAPAEAGRAGQTVVTENR